MKLSEYLIENADVQMRYTHPYAWDKNKVIAINFTGKLDSVMFGSFNKKIDTQNVSLILTQIGENYTIMLKSLESDSMLEILNINYRIFYCIIEFDYNPFTKVFYVEVKFDKQKAIADVHITLSEMKKLEYTVQVEKGKRINIECDQKEEEKIKKMMEDFKYNSENE